jgi:hypothetical protein
MYSYGYVIECKDSCVTWGRHVTYFSANSSSLPANDLLVLLVLSEITESCYN